MRPVPAPDELEGLILYDGVCLFCSRWVRWIIERDEEGRFRFVAVQNEQGRALALRIGIDPDAPESNAVILGGQALFKSDAALAVLASLPGWSWTKTVRAVPRGLRDWAYDRVAENRYRLFGRTDACWLPPPETRERFLDEIV